MLVENEILFGTVTQNCPTFLVNLDAELSARIVELRGLVAHMRNHTKNCTVILDNGEEIDPNKVSELSDTVQPGQYQAQLLHLQQYQ